MSLLPCRAMLRSPNLILRRLCNNRQLIHSAKQSDEAQEKNSVNVSKYTEEELQKICDHSGLHPTHYRLIHNLPAPPPDEITMYSSTLLKNRRSDIGIAGFASQYDPGTCFYTKEEMEDFIEYEKVAFNVPLLEVRRRELEKIAQNKKEKKEREERILKSMAEMKDWKIRLREKVLEKERIAEKAKDDRAKLLEDVRRFFGYKIDPRDEKFQQMLEFKEKEIEARKKLEKKQKKEELFLAKLAELEKNTKAEKLETRSEDTE